MRSVFPVKSLSTPRKARPVVTAAKWSFDLVHRMAAPGQKRSLTDGCFRPIAVNGKVGLL